MSAGAEQTFLFGTLLFLTRSVLFDSSVSADLGQRDPRQPGPRLQLQRRRVLQGGHHARHDGPRAQPHGRGHGQVHRPGPLHQHVDLRRPGEHQPQQGLPALPHPRPPPPRRHPSGQHRLGDHNAQGPPAGDARAPVPRDGHHPPGALWRSRQQRPVQDRLGVCGGPQPGGKHHGHEADA
eukprot:scaffold18351_cov45-Prasinocladus_malaysianus.AAC.1